MKGAKLLASMLSLDLRHWLAGTAALPKGSEVVLFNQHREFEVMSTVVKKVSTQHVKFVHIRGNPLDRDEVRSKLRLET